jgi:hypothetical protein
MAELGLVTCARVALQVGQAALPAYRSQFSRHRFQQPQGLAILCLMPDEEWPFVKPQSGWPNTLSCGRR